MISSGYTYPCGPAAPAGGAAGWTAVPAGVATVGVLTVSRNWSRPKPSMNDESQSDQVITLGRLLAKCAPNAVTTAIAVVTAKLANSIGSTFHHTPVVRRGVTTCGGRVKAVSAANGT